MKGAFISMQDVYTFVPYSGYPQQLPTASGHPLTVVIDACNPSSFRKLWGMTLLERNLRLVERLGASNIHVLVLPNDEKQARKRRFPATTRPEFHVISGKAFDTIWQIIDLSKGPVLAIEGMGLYDRRIIALLWQTAAPAVGTHRGQTLAALSVIVPQSFKADRKNCTSWQEFSEHCLQHPDSTKIDLDSVENRVSLLRKSIRPKVFRISDTETLRKADRYLRDLAGKGINDFMGEFVHPPIEFFLTRIASYTPVTPNQISYFVLLLSLAGLYYFGTGQYWIGIAVNLFRGVIDGVDGKLARLTMRESENGNVLDHGTDTAYLPLLFLALGYSLSGENFLSGTAITVYVLQICYWFNRVFSSWFRTFLGADESEFRPLDRQVRRFQPKRNNFILIMIIALLFETPEAGLYGITGLTVFFMLYRVGRLDQEGRALSKKRTLAKSEA